MAELGSAEFVLRADAAQLIRSLDDAEKKVKAATAQIAQSMGVSERAVTQAAAQLAKAQDAQTAGFSSLAKSAAGAAVAVTGVTVGLAALHEGLNASAEATLKAEQAQRTLTAAYRDSAPQFKAFADAQAQAFGRTNSEVENGVARLSILQKQYGITSDEIQKLTTVALNLGTTFGDTSEAIRSVQAAIRGEPEALEKYGIALQENAIKNSRLLTEEERKNFTSLDAITQARIRYRIILAESAQFEGAATERAQSAQGSFDRLARATDEAAKSIGERLVPALAKGADGVAGYLEKSQGVAARNAELAASFEDFARRYTTALGPLSAIGFLDIITGRKPGAPPAPPAQSPADAPPSGVMFGPSVADVKAINDRFEAEERRRQKELADLRKEARADEAKAQTQAAEDEHDREVKALDDKKVLLEIERDAKLTAVEEQTKAAIRGIEDEARAAKDASDAEIARLRVEEEAAQRSASDRHDAVVAGLDAEQRATQDATAETIRTLEIERDAAKQASEDRRDAAIDALDAEKRARDAARVAEDRAIEDSATRAARLENDRHEAAVRGFEAETKAANDSKDQQLRALDALAKQAEDQHQARLRRLSDEADADRDRHDAAVRALSDEADAAQAKHDADARAIEDQGKAAAAAHDAALRRLSDEAEAARDALDLANRGFEREQDAAAKTHAARLDEIAAEADAAKDAHDAEVRRLSDEADAAKDDHEARLRALSDEADAAEDAHKRTLRRLDDERDAARDAHEATIRALSDEADAADAAHTATLRGLREEQDARLGILDTQLKALDAQERQADAADRLGALQRKVGEAQQALGVAQGTGTPEQIAAARGRLTDAYRTGNQLFVRDAQEELERLAGHGAAAVKKAQEDLAASQKALLDEQTKQGRDAQREQLKDQQDAIKGEIDARKKAADDALELIKARVAAEKDAADRSLDETARRLDGEKRAADDALALIKDRVAAERRAEDDRFALIQAELKARKDAATDAYKLVQDDLKARKDAADAASKLVTDDIEARKQAAADAYKLVQDRLEKEKRAEDDAYQQGADRRAAAKLALDDEYKRGQDRRAAAKKDLDDELTSALKRISDEKVAADDALAKTKDRLDKRKVAVGDANKDELEKIQARKDAEKDAHDAAVLAARDQATETKRAVQDRRDAEELADKARRKEIQDAFDNEARDRRARYDDEATGEIPALRRALEAAQNHFRERKEAADKAYQDEQRQIADTYTNEQTGLIPVAQRAASAVARGFQDQTRAVTEEAAKQKKEINDQYTNAAKTGLLDLLERARADSQDKLDKQRQYWQAWAEDIGGPNGQIQKVIGKFDDLIDKIKKAGGTVNVGGGPSSQHDAGQGDDPGHGPGPSAGAGGGGVPDPYAVSFPFGARYSNPFNPDIPVHRGVDLVVKGAANGGKGHPVTAFEDGEVTYDGYDPNGGNGIIIKGTDGLYHRYFHFDSTDVEMGQQIHRGDVIGRLGESGTEGSPHLHYEVSHRSNGDPQGDLIDPVPYMTAAGTPGARPGSRLSGRTFEFDLFGRHFVVTLPGGRGGLELIRAIEEMGREMEGRDFGRAAAAIALSEGADGDLTQPGSGGARGPFQFDPGGELPNYAHYLHKSLEEAGDYAGENPLDAARWALEGYLGDALREGLNEDLHGADLAEYGSREGQRPDGDLWRRAGDAYRELYGYANGGIIPEPTLLVGRTRGPYAIAGEMGTPEWVTPHAPGAGGADLGTLADRIIRGVAATRPITLVGTAEDLARRTRRILEREARDHESLRGVRR
jgi:murein DD-endopeptidase MepM/ murein hydrolase activator NlpD